MRHLVKIWRNKRALVAGIVVLALFILAPAALSRPGVVLQVVMPEVTVVASDNTAAESAANTGTFTISRSGPTTDPLTVNFSISGTATNGSDYSSLSNSVVIPATQASVAVLVTPTNDAIHEDTENVIVTVTGGAGYTVGSPSSATVTISDDDLPSVSVAATDASASEAGVNVGTFTISRVGATTGALTVAYTLTGTATNGADYSSLSTSVVIPVGQSSAAITVTPTNDGVSEPAETVILTITANALYTVGSPSSATVTISDDDLPSVSVTATDASASETGVNVGTFTISRVGATTGVLTVAYTLTGTASNGTDYSSLSTSVVIPVGQSSVAITVTPTNDGVSEPSETVILTITANALYTIGSPSAATVTISDDDLPTVKIVATDGSAAEAGANVGTFTVTRTGVLTVPMTVNYTISGSATNGSDFGALSGSVVIAAGAASATVVVTPIDDGIDENNESVILTLASGAGYRIGSPNHDQVTIADNDGTPNPRNGDDDDGDDDEDDEGDDRDGDDRDRDDGDGDGDGDDRDGDDDDRDGDGDDRGDEDEGEGED